MMDDLRDFIEKCLKLSTEQRRTVAAFVNGLQIGAALTNEDVKE